MVIPLGLEPKAYCLEGSCSIQLSYGTDLTANCGCKGRHFFANCKILDRKSDITAVIERVKTLREAFCGLEVANVKGIITALFVEAGFGLCEGGIEEGITVGGKDDLPRTEVEGDGGHASRGWESRR